MSTNSGGESSDGGRCETLPRPDGLAERLTAAWWILQTAMELTAGEQFHFDRPPTWLRLNHGQARWLQRALEDAAAVLMSVPPCVSAEEGVGRVTEE